MTNLNEITEKMIIEMYEATRKFGKFNSTHEGYAVLLEELDELFDVIKQKGSRKRLAEEAIQIGAMAIRFVYDFGDIRND